ncbi:hypothetical protein ACQU0X_30900 [Pseudovibrio ascidiaceicola]|uniref:hypothetical protein n=1 Tax=Pseudovibrio ascidiaceicola TaxID=285279 RepID=UPI003D363B49
MRILSAKVENYMGVKLFDASFDPEKDVFEITGKNGQGKTGSLDGIWAAIAGKAAIADNPIRDGEENALLEVNFGHLIVTRKFKRKEGLDYTTQLTLTTPEGARFPAPQDRLNEFFNAIALDPIEFLRKDSKQQTKTFRSLITDFDFDGNDEQINSLSEKRLNANREVKSLQARLDVFSLPAKLPTEEIDESALIDQLTNAQERNQARQNEINNRNTRKAEVIELRDLANQKSVECAQAVPSAKDEGDRLIAAAKAEAEKLIRDAEEHSRSLAKEAKEGQQEANDIETMLSELDPISDAINPLEIQEEIAEAKSSNSLYAKKLQYDELVEELRLKKLDSSGYDTQIADLRKKAEDAVKSADLPVPGISFDDGGLTFSGFPLSQASKAEQIRVCCAIVAALNPELRICRISDGSLLDEDSFELLKGFAKKYDMQVFIETVESSRDGAIVIEAGEIIKQD